MSDLISKQALLKEFDNYNQGNALAAVWRLRQIITNAPAIEQGEAVAYRHLHDDGWEYYDAPTGSDCSSCKALFTTPQQPQSVAGALEEAAKICDDYANSNFGSLVDSGQNGAYVCSKAIRALIKRNAEGVE